MAGGTASADVIGNCAFARDLEVNDALGERAWVRMSHGSCPLTRNLTLTAFGAACHYGPGSAVPASRCAKSPAGMGRPQ